MLPVKLSVQLLEDRTNPTILGSFPSDPPPALDPGLIAVGAPEPIAAPATTDAGDLIATGPELIDPTEEPIGEPDGPLTGGTSSVHVGDDCFFDLEWMTEEEYIEFMFWFESMFMEPTPDLLP